MRRAWEDWLAAECAAQPVLLVLEDLHWGDLGTVSFVDAALRNLRDAAADGAGAGAARGATTRFPQLWQARELQTIRLAPLVAAREREAGARGAGRRRRRRGGRAIVERADGNAFYLEELIRAAADGRSESLPETVLGMVQARLDAEGPDARRVLRAASVFGERFWRAGRGGAARRRGAGARRVATAIELLCARELVARAAIAAPSGRATSS